MSNKRKLAIIGAGGHGKVVADAALAMGCWNEIVFLDDHSHVKTIVGIPVLGGLALLGQTVCASEYKLVIAIGHNATRQRMLEQFSAEGFSLATIIHPSATVSPFSHVGVGTVIFAQAVVNPDSLIGRGCIINTSASVDHDCRLADFVHISPGVHLAGNTSVGTLSWVGIGACTRQQIQIGTQVMVGAGAVVIENIADGLTVVGNPAKVK